MKTKQITEGAIFTGMTLVLILLAYYISFLSVIIILLLPLPTIILYYRQGRTTTILECVATSVLTLLLINPINGIIYCAYFILPGLLLGYCYSKQKAGAERIFYGFIGFFIAFALELIITQSYTGVSFVEEYMTEINSAKDSYLALLQSTGTSTTEFSGEFDQLIEMIRYLIPTLLILTPFLSSVLTVLLTDLLFRFLKLKYIPVKPITEFQIPPVPRFFLGLTAVIGIGSELFTTNTQYYIYSYTLVSLVTIVFLVMGFSFIFWAIKEKTGKAHIGLRILVLVLSLIFTMVLVVVETIGVLDVFFNLRRFVKGKDSVG